MIASGSDEAYLIVNADDYAYFKCVTDGILKAAAQGLVTATGVLANAPRFGEDVARLRACPGLDVGVHLNLTEGVPLTDELRTALARSSGRFAGKWYMAAAILRGVVRLDAVEREWRAQIERCTASGVEVRFLNSHEHIHMLPALFALTQALARDYRIDHVRVPTAELDGASSVGSLIRAAIVGVLGHVNRRSTSGPRVRFLGLEASGRLDRGYFERTLPRLKKGEIYELMCHPGEYDPAEVSDARLTDYHDWEGELRTLTGSDVRELLRRHGVRTIGYRHLEICAARFALRPEARASV
jgi:predicted glycoside hydrolase/deacetylase ChbG (UPF0249 family)